ncbi:MAG: glutamate racemase [Candidatus Omnitrophica bacterium]|nr:glutamate racemase [Candidatus Omnitrophota bacterium]
MERTKQNAPIGVFDSGFGGLTVVKELMRQLPGEDLVYFGDTARVPYGTKSKESIIRFSVENTEVLLKQNVKMVVVACNSSASYALEVLKNKYDIPIIGVIDPGAKKATQVSRNKRIGVIATSATVNSYSYDKAIKYFDSSVKIFSQACPLFVPLVEEGWAHKRIAVDLAEEYLKGMKKSGVDALILGCTHYPLLKNVLKKVMGKKVYLVDSAKEVAGEVKNVLLKEGLSAKQGQGKYRFLISDRPQHFQIIARKFLGRPIQVELVNDR